MSTEPNDGITDKEQYDAAVSDLAQFPHGIDSITAWVSGSVWARDRLTAQEPSDAEVEAAARALYAEDVNESYTEWPAYDSPQNIGRELYIERARNALSAARRARNEGQR